MGAPPTGLTHEELLRIYGYTDGGGARGRGEEIARGEALATDTDYAGEEPNGTVRARFNLVFPDERATLSSERALRIDDAGERAVAQLTGTGLPVAPGYSVRARAGLGGFALVAPEGGRYRAASPDEVARWFLGSALRSSANLGFRRTGDTIVATRGALSLAIASERGGAAHPLACRILVGMFLGGDPAAARTGCEGARMPTRATLRGRGEAAIVLELANRAEVMLPRRALATPPPGASADLALPARAPSGAFFAPSELRALGGTRAPEHALTATNGLAREALLFVDDLAIGWLAPGATATFVGLSAGRHVVRARTLDGSEHTVPQGATFPSTVRLDAANAGP